MNLRLIVILFLLIMLPFGSCMAQQRDLSDKQRNFFVELYPKIVAANKNVQKERNHIIRIEQMINSGDKLTFEDVAFLNLEVVKYKVTQPHSPKQFKTTILELKNRVNVIPPDLILAQAAIESAWGTSRFAKEGNNYFGIHCYGKGCGLYPGNDKNSRFMVKSYDNVEEGIADYIYILNTHRAYKEFRQLRAYDINKNVKLTAKNLAEGLSKYSEKGNEYVKLVQFVAKTYVPTDITTLSEQHEIETAQSEK
ncbi:MAG: glucosaminidase domain-containing protein [Hyphomicrobiales bacterium]